MRKLIWICVLALVSAASALAATVDGVPIHSTATGSGKPLIFVHGWTCDGTSWREQVPEFSKRYRVITIDLPGHGRTAFPKQGPLSMELYGRAIEAVRREAGADKVVLVGHSMGAAVIRAYAQTHPQHVVALVGVDGFLDFGFMKGQIPKIPPLTGPEGLKAREQMVRAMFTPQTPADVQQDVLKVMLGTSEATAAGAMDASFAWLRKPIAPLPTPAYAIYAGTMQVPDANEMKKGLPNYAAIQMPGTGHFLMLEQPQAFNRLLADYLSRIGY